MSDSKFIIICVEGLVLNLIGASIASVFNLSVYLDSIGTIFIAALGGYVPGIVVGFFTNFLRVFFDSQQMYYSSVSLLIAILTTFFARRGYYDKLGKVMTLVPLMAFLTGTFDLLIENFLESSSVFHSVNEFRVNYMGNFFNEFLDKGFSMVVAFVLLRSMSPQIKKEFKTFGQKQAPIPQEMRQSINEQKYRIPSLPTKLLLIVLLSSLLVSFSIAFISYILFRNGVMDDRIKTVDGINAVILNEINPYLIDDYMRLGRASKEYRDIEDKLYAIKNSNFDIKYLYVYKIDEVGCHVVFDLNTAKENGDKPGDIAPFDESLKPSDIKSLIAGRPISPIISDDEYGHLLTLYKPLYDMSGKCRCYAIVDYSMDILYDYMRIFTIKLLALFAGCFIFILTLSMAFIENHVTLPINTMAYCAQHFSYDNLEVRKDNVKLIKSLKIHTGDEIENLYSSMIETTENVVDYLENLQKARIQVADMQVKFTTLDQKAHKDSLTGIKNKTSYVEMIEYLDKRIAEGDVEFCIVMVDVNYLKKVNDTYGHERGNEYLINACRLTCSVFGEEHVYRIGGDEFVVVIEGEKVSLCRYFVEQFRAEMLRKNSNILLEPWEKVSAAVGIAFYDSTVDKSADEVFKRADKEMYANKLAMKAARTD